ncbi:hypothetical protein [Croceicoccus marinus]|uniref:hypothetical protein n=1 Tax=Croceicoccus marinus TaxID=450378 RepID=UPI0012F86247|nr:hypothetical protein [Croceicoccus marinus]
MAKRGRYRTSAMAKLAAVLLVAALAWAAWEFGLFTAIAELSTVRVPASARG